MNQTEMKKIAAEVRKNIIRMTCAAQSGRPGGSVVGGRNSRFPVL